MTEAPPLPIVALVGRPNVGKSTLFNRYAGHRRALVADLPGTTRDWLVEEVEVAGRQVLLVDTAGLDPDAEGGLAAAVQRQARAALEEADAILFVVDARAGLLPEDEAFARELRRGERPLVLVVNKVDHPKHEAQANEFHALGLAPLVTVSAEHGRGVWDALEQLVEKLPKPPEPCAEEAPEAEDAPLRVAIVGRPNAGKSSLLNRLVGQERVVVSEEPGTTRDAVDIRLEHEDGDLIFVDTAGLRRSGRRQPGPERGSAMMALRAVERADVALLVVDAAGGIADHDARIAQLARERGAAVAIVLNKWDVVETRDADERQRLRSQVEERLRWLEDAPVLRVSAKTGKSLGRILPAIRRLGAAQRRRVPTAELNRWLEDAVRRHEPAMAQKGVRRRPIKFFYATQVAISPPTFALFCTDPRAVQDSYVRFLTRRLRESFDLDGAPIVLRLRARREE